MYTDADDTYMMMMIMMVMISMMISLFNNGQLGLWAPSSGVV
jgi:hypothetical protein